MVWYPLEWCYRMGVTGNQHKIKLVTRLIADNAQTLQL